MSLSRLFARRGAPTALEFTLSSLAVSPWGAEEPQRRLAIRWMRGTKARRLGGLSPLASPG